LDALGYDSGTGTTIEEKIKTGYGTVNTYNDAGQPRQAIYLPRLMAMEIQQNTPITS
jgi:hypothetical protein